MLKSEKEKKTPFLGTRFLITLGILLALLLLNVGIVSADASAAPSNPVLKQAADAQNVMMMHNVTTAQRIAAAKDAAAKGLVVGASGSSAVKSGFGIQAVPLVPVPGGTPDYFGPYSNYANSQMPATDGIGNVTPGTGIRKFVDSLPGLGPAGANNLGQYIPVAVPDKTSYPGSDFYEIALVRYHEKMHSDINATALMGYVQIETPKVTGAHIPLAYPNGSPILNATGGQVYAVDKPHYLGPIIVSTKDVPTRVKFQNYLPTGTDGNLIIPVDTSMMGAGIGPNGIDMYAQNRATIHLHGGNTPWISDGTPHQWTTPAGENTPYPKGVSVQNVPDMDGGIEPAGTLTFYYTNQQSARLMFYHDHAYGITRLNVYGGQAAGYLVTDPTEAMLLANNAIPDAVGIPLVFEDKSWVPDAVQMNATDPTWNSGDPYTAWPHTGSLYYNHVYMPIQNPYTPGSINPMGRWDYGPWFWPPFTGFLNQPVANPYAGNGPWEPPMMPATPNPSSSPESFMDIMTVNGAALPYVQLGPHAYRFRILNACNDRTLNLQLYYAGSNATMWNGQNLLDGKAGEVNMAPAIAGQLDQPANWPTDGRAGGVPWANASGPSWVQIGTEGGLLPAPVVIPPQPVVYDFNHVYGGVINIQNHSLLLMAAQRADVIVDFTGIPDGTKLIVYNDAPAPAPGGDSRYDYYTGDGDQTLIGGANNTYAGYAPNTRTVMQIQINSSVAGGTFNMANLQAKLPVAYATYQDKPIVPETVYNTPFNSTFPTQYVNLVNTSMSFVPAGASTQSTIDIRPKAIIGDFEMNYGRLTALLGTEIRRTPSNIESRIAYGYIDPPTEIFNNSVNTTLIGTLADGTQIWRITNVDVDLHPLHWHMFNVQVLNRVIWDGTVLPPEPNEVGWKETVNTPPLTDTIVAIRPIAPNLPWEIPNSIRPLSPQDPIGSTIGFAGVAPDGTQAPVVNHVVNFGWEYVFHCHILGHEENDFMHPMAIAVAPKVPPTNLTALIVNNKVNLSWQDNSISETDWSIQRSTTVNGPWTDLAQIPSATIPQTGARVFFTDPTVLVPNQTFSYRVLATNVVGDRTVYPNTVGYPTVTTNSTPSTPSTPVTVPAANFIRVTIPNGGETWVTGTTPTIKWVSNGTVGASVKIELLKAGVRVVNISLSTPNDGTFASWMIPANQAVGADYKVRITSTTNPSITDSSDNNFSIVNPTPSITVIYPNGGETLVKGTKPTLKWSSIGTVGANVKIELLKAGVLAQTISASTPNDGSFVSWIIPSSLVLGTDYKIRITSTTNPAITDTSNANFTIVAAPGTIKVLSPNGGETWTRGTTPVITWSWTGTVGTNVKIELLNGAAAQTISASTPNDGKFSSWPIPAGQAVGTNYKVRIASILNPAINDTSNATFKII